MTALTGKFFLGYQDGIRITGEVWDDINTDHYLVRVDCLIDVIEGVNVAVPATAHYAVAAVADMVGGNGNEDAPPSWFFFDTAEQRAKFQAWLRELPPDRRLRIVPLRKPDAKE
jgi:hypothetical protein